MSETPATPHVPDDNSAAAEKVRSFPHTPGVYLMKDAAGRVIYIGKAKDLRARAGSYFLKAAAEDLRTARLVGEIRDIDYLDAESEVDALLMEARLIKDLLPKFNRELRDSKTFPYLEIHTHEDYPRVEITRTPSQRGVKLYGPFANSRSLARGVASAAEDFPVSHLLAGHPAGRQPLAVVSPLPAGGHRPMYRAVQLPHLPGGISQEHPPVADVSRRARSNRSWTTCAARWPRRPPTLRFEEAARLRDEIHLLETLNERGQLDTHVQPEVFPVDPKKGLAGLHKVLHLSKRPRSIEGVDMAHTAGTDTVASVVQFIDGLPFKPGYKRLRIRSVEGDRRRGQHPRGGAAAVPPARRERDRARHPADRRRQGAVARGDLRPGESADRHPPAGDLAGQARGVDFCAGEDEPLRLSRHRYALRLLQYVRDEAHRFAQHYHHILRRRSTLGE